MKITILGAGNMGCANAADLTIKGHEVTLVKTSQSMHNDTFKYVSEHDNTITLWQEGVEQTAHIHELTTSLESIQTADLVYITTQTTVHEELIKRIAPYLRDGQAILITPGYFSTAYFLKHCPDKDLTIIEGESSTIDCRINEVGVIRVGFRNVRNPLGVYPAKNLPKVKDMLDSMKFHYVYLSSVIEAALHNPNMIIHTVGAIMSIPRIEKTKGEYCMYWEVWTPSVYKILNALDSEKMNVLEKFGYERLSYFEACKYRNSLDETQDAVAVFEEYAASPYRAKGPTVVDSRYISEDVPQGLVMLEALSQHLGLQTPVCTGLINIASAALGRDLRAEGRTLERLGEENVQKIFADSNRTF